MAKDVQAVIDDGISSVKESAEPQFDRLERAIYLLAEKAIECTEKWPAHMLQSKTPVPIRRRRLAQQMGDMRDMSEQVPFPPLTPLLTPSLLYPPAPHHSLP
jgi:hypothetical protein